MRPGSEFLTKKKYADDHVRSYISTEEEEYE